MGRAGACVVSVLRMSAQTDAQWLVLAEPRVGSIEWQHCSRRQHKDGDTWDTMYVAGSWQPHRFHTACQPSDNCCRKLLLAEPVDEDRILEQAFMFFDRDGNKEISIAELTTTMRELGDLLTADEIAKFVAIMDKNSDGVVGVSVCLCGGGDRGDKDIRKCLLSYSLTGCCCPAVAAVAATTAAAVRGVPAGLAQ